MSLILSDQPGLLGPKVEASFYFPLMLPVSFNMYSVKFLMFIVYTGMLQVKIKFRLKLNSFVS